MFRNLIEKSKRNLIKQWLKMKNLSCSNFIFNGKLFIILDPQINY